MAISKKSKQLINNYIVEKILDPEEKTNSSTKMRSAGYGESVVSKGPLAVEETKYYSDIVKEVLDKVCTGNSILAKDITNSIENGELENLPLKDKVSIFKTLVQIGAILAPVYKEKESYKTEGGMKTVWKQLG